MRTIRLVGLLALVVCTSLGRGAQTTPPANYDESKVGPYTLPDPLLFNDGKRVRNARDWDRRRGELLRLFAENVYGRTPRPRAIEFTVFDHEKGALGGHAVRKQVTIYFSSDKSGPKEDVLMYVPASAKKPVPLILSCG